MRKYLLTMAVIVVFAIGFAASDDSSSSSSTSSEEVQKPAQKPDFLGTYEIKDNAGIVYHFVLNEDGTVKIIFNPDIEHGRHYTLTGKWKDCRKYHSGVQIEYDDIDRIPAIRFPNGIHADWSDKCAYLRDGFYYPDFFTCDKKNADWRLKYTKIK